MTRRILIFGNSHTVALRDGLKFAPPPPGTEVEVLQLLSGTPEKPVGDITQDEAFARMRDLGPEDCLVVTIFGTYHNLLGLLNHPEAFTLLATDENSDENSDTNPAVLIPQAVMRSHLRRALSKGDLLGDMARAAACPTYHMMPPPPKADLSHLANSTKVYRGQEVSAAGFSPAARRLAFWQVEAAVVAEHARDRGLGVIDIPADLRDAQGCLAPPFQLRDATHANATYGARMLHEIMALRYGSDRAA